jgi:hypothetical protein
VIRQLVSALVFWWVALRVLLWSAVVLVVALGAALEVLLAVVLVVALGAALEALLAVELVVVLELPLPPVLAPDHAELFS